MNLRKESRVSVLQQILIFSSLWHIYVISFFWSKYILLVHRKLCWINIPEQRRSSAFYSLPHSLLVSRSPVPTLIISILCSSKHHLYMTVSFVPGHPRTLIAPGGVVHLCQATNVIFSPFRVQISSPNRDEGSGE